MKTMTCRQLGGACEKPFTASTFDEIAAKSKRHAMEMYDKKDEAHLAAMDKMSSLTNDPEALEKWMDTKRKEFEALPDDSA